jgi:hypothetical protein
VPYDFYKSVSLLIKKKRKKKSMWDDIIEKMDRRLAGWK